MPKRRQTRRAAPIYVSSEKERDKLNDFFVSHEVQATFLSKNGYRTGAYKTQAFLTRGNEGKARIDVRVEPYIKRDLDEIGSARKMNLTESVSQAIEFWVNYHHFLILSTADEIAFCISKTNVPRAREILERNKDPNMFFEFDESTKLLIEGIESMPTLKLKDYKSVLSVDDLRYFASIAVFDNAFEIILDSEK